jgi:GT2 family glycosyltransferase
MQESLAASSLLRILGDDSSLPKHFSLVVYDNSPQAQELQPSGPVPLLYQHDPENSGLAAAYNFALARAAEQGLEWLLLFDQDTSVTREFLLELVTETANLREETRVAAIVPKLLVGEVVYSPATHFLDVLRKQFSPSGPNLFGTRMGVQHDRINVYNSASTLRVSAMQAMGGFPREFWLDYLDHTVFHTLFVKGYRIYVMKASLEHHQSNADLRHISHSRHQNSLLAQSLFVKRYGSFVDRLLYRIWLLRHTRKLRSECLDKRVWQATAWQALSLRTPRAIKR